MATKTRKKPPTGKGLTYEKVWAALMEDRKQQAEQKKEFVGFFDEVRELQKENARQMGDLHNRFGELAEHLVVPSIVEKFNKMGFHFDSVAPGGEKITDGEGKTIAQVDIVLRNSNYIVAVEVKSKPKLKDIPEHIKRLEILRAYWTNRGDKRKLCGAIAGAIFPKNVKEEALEAGLYVLVQSGDTMKIDIPDGFKARIW